MIQVNDIVIANITNGTAYIDSYGKVIVEMADGFEFWDKKDYFTDGVYAQPDAEDIIYYTRYSFSPERDFSLLIEKGAEIPTAEEKAEAYDILMGVEG